MGMRHGLLRTSCSRNPENTSNPLIFLRKMATFRCFALHKVINFHASMKFMTFCRLSHEMMSGAKGHAFHVFMKKHDIKTRKNMRKQADRRIPNVFRIAGAQSAERSIVSS